MFAGAVRILDALRDGDKAVYELIPVVNLTKRTIHSDNYMPALHSQRLVHIVRWVHARNSILPVYRLGDGKDATRPPPFTGTQKTERYRKRHKEMVNFKRKVKRAVKLKRPIFKRVCDPLLDAMGAFN